MCLCCVSVLAHVGCWLHLCCGSCCINTDAKLQHTVHHPLYWNYTICRKQQWLPFVAVWIHGNAVWVLVYLLQAIAIWTSNSFLSNMGSLNGHNMFKMAASGISFSLFSLLEWLSAAIGSDVSHQAAEQWEIRHEWWWCALTSFYDAPAPGTSWESRLPWVCSQDTFHSKHSQSSHAPFSALGSRCSVSMNIKMQLKATGYDNMVLSVK